MSARNHVGLFCRGCKGYRPVLPLEVFGLWDGAPRNRAIISPKVLALNRERPDQLHSVYAKLCRVVSEVYCYPN